MSMYPLAAGIRAASKGKSGLHFTVAADDDQLAFCPLQFLETKGDRAWAMEWIDTILTLNGVETTPGQRNEIGNAILSMHASGAHTLSEFSVKIQDETIREAIRQYQVDRSEERRVGKKEVRRCRCRWARDHKRKKTRIN